ncbi:MAG: type II toxin-antitoxin system ParD family antitoxin [Planctomycetota bacterium]|nr:type II toxin-antitoxin system ParD family antitoxin [Planctomycetota bacterium]
MDKLGHRGHPSSLKVSLTPEQVRYIEEKVQTGRYQTAAEVVREGLRVLMERDTDAVQRFEVWREEVRRKIDFGLEQAKRGEVVDGDQVFAELIHSIARHRKK